jgi:hypothetical protein
MRDVASAGKRDEDDTIGTFGIGFISVYGFTDTPEIHSQEVLWKLIPENPEHQRIEVLEKSPHALPNCDHTRIALPWVFDDTHLRQELEQTKLSPNQIRAFQEELVKELPHILLFVKHVDRIEVLSKGQLIAAAIRHRQSSTTFEIENEKGDRQKWLILRKSFADVAQQLRTKYPMIPPKKSTEVTIAYNADHDVKTNGLIFSYLPTEHHTGFNFHINADFFPVPDRKHIDFDGSKHKVEWNNAALKAAAYLFADSMRTLAPAVGHTLFFRSLENLFAARSNNHLSVFWTHAKEHAPKSRIMYSSQGKWFYPEEIRLVSDKVELESSDALTSLSIHVNHADLSKHETLLTQFDVQRINLEDIANAFRKAPVQNDMPVKSSPAWISDKSQRRKLYKLIDHIFRRGKSENQAQQLILSMPIGISTSGRIRQLGKLFRIDKKLLKLFSPVTDKLTFADRDEMFADESQIYNRVPDLSPTDVIRAFHDAFQSSGKRVLNDLSALGTEINDLHYWFSRRAEQLDLQWHAALVKLPIYPSGNTFLPLPDLMLPSIRFKDPFGLAEVVKTDGISKEVLIFWRELGAREIDWSLLISKKLCPYLNTERDIPDEQLREVIEWLADSMEEIRNRRDIMTALEECRLVPCTDTVRRRPGQVYFNSPEVAEMLGPLAKYVKVSGTGKSNDIRSFLELLGVESSPRISDICARIMSLVAVPPTDESISQIQKIYKYLAENYTDLSIEDRNEIGKLRSLRWLPELSDRRNWYKPTDLYTRANAKLFESQGKFVAFSDALKKEIRDAFGIKDDPSVDLVINHLLHCRETHKTPHIDIYKFLQRQMSTDRDYIVGELQDTHCIFIDGNFRKPSELLWKSHRLGRWRVTLDEKFKPYHTLLNDLGAKEDPTAMDFRDVVLSIADEFGSKNRPIDDQANEVLSYCYAELASRFVRGQKPFDLAPLKAAKTIANEKDNLLFLPKDLLFKDKLKYIQLIGGQIDQFLIPKEEHTASFFSLLGVRSLSKAVVREPKIQGNARPYDELELWLNELSPLIKQVVLQAGHTSEIHLSQELFEDLTVYAVDSILEALYLPMGDKEKARRLTVSEPLPTTAFLDDENSKLFVVEKDYSVTDLAHQIAIFLNPEVDSCTIVAPLERLLDAEDFEEASQVLHRWGYDVVKRTTAPRHGVEGTTATALGDDHDLPEDAHYFEPDTDQDSDKEPDVSPPGKPLLRSPAMPPISGPDSGNGNDASDHDLGAMQPDVEKYLNEKRDRKGGEYSPLPPPLPTRNPQRRTILKGQDILDARANEPPEYMRYEHKSRKVWKEPDSGVRAALMAWYDGKCQICNDSFPTAGGRPFFQSHNIIKAKKVGEWIESGANSLCLCATHAAQYEFGFPSVKLRTFVTQIRDCDLSQRLQYYRFDLFLVGKLCQITFTHDHLHELQLLLMTDDELRELLRLETDTALDSNP